MCVCYYFLNLLQDYEFVQANCQISERANLDLPTALKLLDQF